MFNLFLGLIWTIIVAIVTFVFYGNSGGTITVNGEIVSQAEFNGMLFPKIFLGIFWIIGIFFIIKGAKKIFIDKKTSVLGEETFARIINMYPSGASVNNIPEIKADFCVYIPSSNNTEIISEILGLNVVKYSIGSYVSVKYYEGDINITSLISEEQVPYGIKEKLNSDILTKEYLEKNEDVILVDGVKYKKVDDEKNNI